MELRACLRCGSSDLRLPGMQDAAPAGGGVVGEGQNLALWTCVTCGWTAVPLLFDDEKARVAYAKERAKARVKG